MTFESWERWRGIAEGQGLAFTAAEQYRAFPPPPADSPAGSSAAEAARALVPLIERTRPDVVVNDILTLAPALAADLAGVPRATLVPHIYPETPRGFPFFSIGLGPPRTPLGAALWRAALPILHLGLRRGRREWNEMRARLGLDPVERLHAGLSDALTLVATFPQLEYPRRWPPEVRITGPMYFETPHPEVELPPGGDPLVLVAPSTSQDPGNRLVRAALAGLAGESVRVIATTNRVRPTSPIPVPANARLVEWLSYSQVLPQASLVICHGGHGTVARCLGEGVPVLVSPVAGDMAETAMRVSWAGAGRYLPWRLCGPRTVRWAARDLLGDDRFARSAAGFSASARERDGASQAADLIEEKFSIPN